MSRIPKSSWQCSLGSSHSQFTSLPWWENYRSKVHRNSAAPVSTTISLPLAEIHSSFSPALHWVHFNSSFSCSYVLTRILSITLWAVPRTHQLYSLVFLSAVEIWHPIGLWIWQVNSNPLYDRCNPATWCSFNTLSTSPCPSSSFSHWISRSDFGHYIVSCPNDATIETLHRLPIIFVIVLRAIVADVTRRQFTREVIPSTRRTRPEHRTCSLSRTLSDLCCWLSTMTSRSSSHHTSNKKRRLHLPLFTSNSPQQRRPRCRLSTPFL